MLWFDFQGPEPTSTCPSLYIIRGYFSPIVQRSLRSDVMSWPSGEAAPVDKGGPSPSSPPPPYEPFQSPSPDEGGPSMLNSQDAWKSRDPRSSSTQSLLPSLNEGRRTLLVVYIHGFMGDNTSFQSFPAHVHNYLREELSETHVIHSKIYPRYKTYKAIEVARDNFSKWLEPHEDENTDVILIGHSMGGLLAADVALMVNRPFSILTPLGCVVDISLAVSESCVRGPLEASNPGYYLSRCTSTGPPPWHHQVWYC